MSDQTNEATTPDLSGVNRDSTGTIVDQSNQSTNQEQSQQQTQTEKPSLLNQKEAPKEAPKPEEKKEEGKKEEAKPLTGAPETYSDYKMPDGWSLDPDAKKEADTVFKELNLSQDGAQKLMDMYTKNVLEAHNAPFKAYQELTEGWAKEAQDHPDLRGKLGPGQEVNVRIAKFLDNLGDAQLASDFRKIMDLTGAGNHPAFIRVINHAAKLLTEGSHVAGKGPSEAGQSKSGTVTTPSAAQAMYPHLKSGQ